MSKKVEMIKAFTKVGLNRLERATKDLTPEGEVAEDEDTEAPVCEKCGKPFVKKRGRFGIFLACSGYPDCKNTRPLPRRGEGQAQPPELLEET